MRIGIPNARSGPVTVELDIKMNRAVFGKTQFGLERYNELGPLGHLSPIGSIKK